MAMCFLFCLLLFLCFFNGLLRDYKPKSVLIDIDSKNIDRCIRFEAYDIAHHYRALRQHEGEHV